MAKRFLLIEDDQLTLRLMSAILTRAGHEVVAVERVPDAIAALKSQSFDLATCDLMIPDVSGLDFLGMMRKGDLPQHLPVIVVTATGFEAELEQAKNMGAAQILRKPFTSQQLLDTVASVLGH